MAKKSMIARDVKRKKLVERYAAKRKTLIDAFKSAKDPMERLEIHRKIQALPRNCAPNRISGKDYISHFFSFIVSVIVVNVSSRKQIYRIFYSISPIKCKNV